MFLEYDIVFVIISKVFGDKGVKGIEILINCVVRKMLKLSK